MILLDDVKKGVTYYGLCSTPAGNQVKDVTGIIPNNVLPETGTKIIVLFTNANTHTSATLNIPGVINAPIFYRNNQIPSNFIRAGGVYTFVYDGTRWRIEGDIAGSLTTRTIPYSAGVIGTGWYTITQENLLIARLQLNTQNAGVVFAQMPPGFRPRAEIFGIAEMINAGGMPLGNALYVVRTSGNIEVYISSTPTGVTQWRFNFTYPV